MIRSSPPVSVVRSGITVVSVVSSTLTVQVAVRPPFLVVQVMTAVPSFFAVTLPSLDTVATEVLLLFHETVCSAPAG